MQTDTEDDGRCQKSQSLHRFTNGKAESTRQRHLQEPNNLNYKDDTHFQTDLIVSLFIYRGELFHLLTPILKYCFSIHQNNATIPF